MGSNFIQLTNQLGVIEQCPYFFENGKRCFYVFDVPHMLKATHNNLLKCDIEFESKGTKFVTRWA